MKAVSKCRNLLYLNLLLAAVLFCGTVYSGEPLKVFILAGQSNMEGHGKAYINLASNETVGTLEYLAINDPDNYGHIMDDGKFIVRDDVWCRYLRLGGTLESGNLTVGFGAGNKIPNDVRIGPEYQFGFVLGDLYDAPVLIIKCAWGGRNLYAQFRPPSSGWPKIPEVETDTGYYYQEIINTVNTFKADPASFCSAYDPADGYEIVGFGWHQGFSDRVSAKYAAEYEVNMANFIRDMRSDLGIPNLPFSISTTGMDPRPEYTTVELAQLEMENFTKYPEFEGNVTVDDTRPYWRTEAPSNMGYHWRHSGESYYLVGKGMGEGMVDLLGVVDSTAPLLDKAVPKALDMDKDFQPPKDGRRESIGFRRTAVIALKPQQGIHPLCVVEVRKGIIANDPFEVGDVIIAVNGKPLTKNPALQFRQAHEKAKKDSGVLWATRWRKGVISRSMIDLGTYPLDLTGEARPGNTRDWRLGPIGANGWCYHRTSNNGASALARQIAITAVDKDGPAAGKLQVGDVILGTNGRKFDIDARKALACAINEAEKEQSHGKLKLKVWRNGKELDVVLTLPVMGSYSKTAPFDCPKTDKIIDNAVKYIEKNKDSLLKPEVWLSYINGLGLLATGRQDVMPMVRDLAHGSILKDGKTLSVEKHVGMQCWSWSYKTVFMCEYYLRTKDRTVLPTIDEYATKIAMGQSGVGTWGHTYAARENTGHLHGHIGGYGAINQQGLTLMIALPLAQKCGITNKEIVDAIKRGDDFFSYFIGRGTIPYGDHGAAKEKFDDNGKSGAAAIYFDLMKNAEGARFFSDMVLGSAPGGREEGHTGHFWSHLWGGMGAARGGDKSLQVFMDVMNPFFTLERQPDGRFAFQGNAGENGKHGDLKTKWDCSGTRLLQLCVPRRATYITGKATSRSTHLTQKRIDRILRAGRLDIDKQAREKLTVKEIFELLEDPLPPIRSVGARTLAQLDINCVDKLIPMLDSKNKYARYGAAEALCKAGYASKAAADKLIRVMATDKDITFQYYAMEALINRDTKRGLLNVAKPAIPVLLKMALTRSPDDPRKVLQQQISLALFYNGSAQPRTGLLKKYGLDGVDRSLLLSAIKDILTNDNGGTRSLCSWVFGKLTKDELNQMWPDLYRATNCATSGVMFAAKMRQTAVSLIAENHFKEGLPVIVKLIRNSRYHSDPRIPDLLPLLSHYGPYAKEFLPQLEEAVVFYESSKRGDRKTLVKLIKETIEKIKAQKDTADFKLESIQDYIN